MGTHLSLTPKTPDKMRVLLALTLLVAGALAGGKEKREMEMWMKMKAMEGCFGEELVKDHMMKMFSEMMDSGNGIQKRAADEDVYDLGSKLHEKLENKNEDDWLRSQLEKYCDQCIEFAENLPQSMLDD